MTLALLLKWIGILAVVALLLFVTFVGLCAYLVIKTPSPFEEDAE
jgi:phage shock protein PspC (stress-responsive transcriptional regulator)